MSNQDLNALFREDRPLIDVRAPVEFTRGAFPCAVNLPILDDEERAKVGSRYAEGGPDEAVALGHELVSGEHKRERIAGWVQQLEQHPDSLLYCFRGGQRSAIAIEWLRAEGYEVPRVEGGYKRLRNHLLKVFEQLPPIIVVAGRTGSGKTEFLQHFDHTIDLESLANHRGSAFGRRLSPQPSQIDFENATAIQFLKQPAGARVLLEDEGRLIGRIHVPLPLQERMQEAAIVLLEEPLDARANRIFNEYIESQWHEYKQHHGEAALMEFKSYLLGAIDAIRKRLGNVAHETVRGMVMNAITRQISDGTLELHRDWITTLLSDYYDPMYSYQLEKKTSRIRFQGSHEEVRQWLTEQQRDN